MGWICQECNCYNEDDSNRECWVCGSLRSKAQIRKDKYKKIKEIIDKIFGRLSRFTFIPYLIIVITGFLMALFLVLTIINNDFFTNFLEMFNVAKDKFLPIGDYFKQIDIPIGSNISGIFKNMGYSITNISDYFIDLFSANPALNAIGPFFREFGFKIGSHFHAFIDFLKGLKWERFSTFVDYIKSVIERIRSHFSASKSEKLISVFLDRLLIMRKLYIIGG